MCYLTRECRNLSSHEISQSLEHWLSSFSEDTSKNICSLYDEQASLWGTLSPVKRDSAVLIKEYFDQIFKYPNRCVKVVDSSIRVFGNMAICNGVYSFSWYNDALKITTVARFSFVYINKMGRWFIIEHHSSSIPVTIQDA